MEINLEKHGDSMSFKHGENQYVLVANWQDGAVDALDLFGSGEESLGYIITLDTASCKIMFILGKAGETQIEVKGNLFCNPDFLEYANENFSAFRPTIK